MSRNGKISEKSKEQMSSKPAEQLTLFREDFHASRFQQPEIEQEKRTSDTFGPKCTGSFARLNQDGSWLKTYQGCSQFLMDGSLEKWSETWPRAGMSFNGIAYRLQPLTPLTNETECGLWATPTVCGNHNRKGASKNSVDGLSTQAKKWPTPKARDFKGACSGDLKKGRQKYNLDSAVVFATPQARDFRTGAVERWNNPRRSRNLNDQAGGKLSVIFVEWLMGLPTGWTDLNCLETAKSFKSLNGSEKE